MNDLEWIICSFMGRKLLISFFVKRILSNTLFHIWLKMEKKCNTLVFFPPKLNFFGDFSPLWILSNILFGLEYLAFALPKRIRIHTKYIQTQRYFFLHKVKSNFLNFVLLLVYIYIFLKGHYWKKLYRLRKYHDLQSLDFFDSEFEKISIKIRVFVTN